MSKTVIPAGLTEEQVESLYQAKRKAIRAAKELGYPIECIKELESVTRKEVIADIMTNYRKRSMK